MTYNLWNPSPPSYVKRLRRTDANRFSGVGNPLAHCNLLYQIILLNVQSADHPSRAFERVMSWLVPQDWFVGNLTVFPISTFLFLFSSLPTPAA